MNNSGSDGLPLEPPQVELSMKRSDFLQPEEHRRDDTHEGVLVDDFERATVGKPGHGVRGAPQAPTLGELQHGVELRRKVVVGAPPSPLLQFDVHHGASRRSELAVIGFCVWHLNLK